MKNPKPNHYKDIIEVLQELQAKYPKYGIGRHISAAFADYGDTWGLTDKEFHFALMKYSVELEGNDTSEAELEKIISDGMNLDTILDDEDDDDGRF